MSLSPSERTLRARLAAHTKWATTDAMEGTAAARAAFLERFELKVDPDGLLDPVERSRRASHARKAYFLELAYKSARARSRTSVREAS
jgi:hypothetical protein